MTTTPEQIRHTWIPKGRGKGGEFSNSTPYDSDADTLITVNNAAIESNAWVPRPAELSPNSFVANGAGTAQYLSPVDVCGNVYTYNSMSLATFFLSGSTPYSSIFASCQSVNGASACGPIPPNTPIGGVNLIDPYNALAKTLFAPRNAAPWVFKTVKNRMYMANGIDPPMIANRNQYSTIGTYPSSTVYKWGIDAPVAAMTYSITTGAITAGNIDVVNGNANITGHGTAFNTATIGQTIFLLGIPYQLGTITSATVASLVGGPNGDGTYKAASGNIPNGGWQINTGNLSWVPGAGYIYSYAYWDSISGHVSNMAPLLYVNDGPPNNGGVSVVLSNIIAAQKPPTHTTDPPTGVPDPRVDNIVIYRSAQGGGVLFPLALIANGAFSPYSYTDTQADDTKLGTVGPGQFPGPYTTNRPPPQDLIYPTYANGRFWAFSPSNPGLLFFSARVDASNSEIPVGVAEECWPLQNTIPIPNSDELGTGTRVVGGTLQVLTTKSIYYLLGSNPASYQLAHVTSKGNGTAHFATCALPGEDANSADALVHCGNDGRVYFLFGAGGDVSYSYPIQDQILLNPNIAQPASGFRVEILHNKQGSYLLVVDGNGFTHAYDMERQIWLKWTLGFGPAGGGGNYAMAEGLLFGVNVFLVANTAGIWALQTDPDPSICNYTPTIVTQRFSPPGVDRFDTTTISEMDLYDIAGYTGWGILISVDGKAPLSYAPNIDTTTRSVLTEPSEIYFPRNTAAVLAQGRTYQITISSITVSSVGKKFKLAKAEAIWTKTTLDTGAPPK